jgi:hypothetical protein
MSESQIKQQLEKVASDVLTEETLESIEQSFNEAVQSKADELAQLRIEKALVEQDEEHSIKLEKLLEAIDADHTSKLEKVVEALDSTHAVKLRTVVERFRTEIDQDAKVFKESLVDNISNYLDLYVEKMIPEQDIKQAVQNKHAVSILESLRKSLSIDKVMANESVREAVIDGKRQIDEAAARLEKLEQENIILKESTQNTQAELMLEKLSEGLPSSKRRHIYKVLQGKTAEFINENFQYTLDMFEKSEQDKLVELKEQATTGKKISDRPVSKSEKVVKESVESQIEQTEPGLQDSNLFNNYMGELNRW